jgi:phospholipase C
MLLRAPKRLCLLLAGIASLAAAATPGLAFASAGHAINSAPGTQAAAQPVAARATAVTGMPDAPIKHVIEIMLENHTFDNLFGSFPGADGIPANISLPNPMATYDSAPDVHPVWATPNEGDVLSALNNSRAVEQMVMDYQPGRGYLTSSFSTRHFSAVRAATRSAR